METFWFFYANRSDCNLEKVNIPEYTVFCVNQAYLTVQKNKNIYYCDFHILSQVEEASNSSYNIDTYVLKDRELKLLRFRYNSETGDFLGLHQTVGFIIIGGDSGEVFFNYGFDKHMSKVLYSHYRRRIPNPFSETIFNHSY